MQITPESFVRNLGSAASRTFDALALRLDLGLRAARTCSRPEPRVHLMELPAKALEPLSARK